MLPPVVSSAALAGKAVMRAIQVMAAAFVNVVFFIWCDYLTFLIVSFSEVIMRSMP